MVPTQPGISAAELQTAFTTLAERDPVFLFKLLGLDTDSLLDMGGEDPDTFNVMFEDRLALLLAGYPTWLPRSDADD